jgi:hypothetical protein
VVAVTAGHCESCEDQPVLRVNVNQAKPSYDDDNLFGIPPGESLRPYHYEKRQSYG